MDREVKVRIDLTGKTDFSQAKQDLAEIQEKVRDIAADTQKIDISPIFRDAKEELQGVEAPDITQKVNFQADTKGIELPKQVTQKVQLQADTKSVELPKQVTQRVNFQADTKPLEVPKQATQSVKIDVDAESASKQVQEAAVDPVVQDVRVEVDADDLYNQMLGVERRTAEATKSVVKQVVKDTGEIWNDFLGKSPVRGLEAQSQATEIMKEVPAKEPAKPGSQAKEERDDEKPKKPVAQATEVMKDQPEEDKPAMDEAEGEPPVSKKPRTIAQATEVVKEENLSDDDEDAVWDNTLGKYVPRQQQKPTQATEVMKEVPEKEPSKPVLQAADAESEDDDEDAVWNSTFGKYVPRKQAKAEDPPEPQPKVQSPRSEHKRRISEIIGEINDIEDATSELSTSQAREIIQVQLKLQSAKRKLQLEQAAAMRRETQRPSYKLFDLKDNTWLEAEHSYEAELDRRERQAMATNAMMGFRKTGDERLKDLQREEARVGTDASLVRRREMQEERDLSINEQEKPKNQEREYEIQRITAVNDARAELASRRAKGDYREASFAYRNDPDTGYQENDIALRKRELTQTIAEQLRLREQLQSSEETALRSGVAGVQNEIERTRILRERLELTARLPHMQEATREQREFMRSPEGRQQTQSIANVQYEKQQAAIEQDKAMRLAMMRAEFGRFGGTLKYAGEEMKKFGAVSTATFMGLHASMLGFASAASPAVMQTATGSMQLLMGQIGIMFIPAIVRVSYHIQNVARWIGSWSEGTKSLVSNAALAATAVISVGWAFGTLFRILGTATTGIFGLIGMFRNAGGGLNSLLPRPGQAPEAPGVAAQPGGNRPGGGQPANNVPANNAPGARPAARPAQAFRGGGAAQGGNAGGGGRPAGGGGRPGGMGAMGWLGLFEVARAMWNWDDDARQVREEESIDREFRRLLVQRERQNPGFRLDAESNRELREEARNGILNQRQGQNVPAVGPQGPLPPNRIPAAAAANAAAPADPRNQRQERPEMAYSLNFQSSQSDIFAYRQQMQIEALKDPMQREIAQMQLDAMNVMVREIQTLNQNIRMR